MEGIQLGEQRGIQLGEQRGIEKGEREATLKIARTMLQSGIDRNTVMAMTGLTEEDLQRVPTDTTAVACWQPAVFTGQPALIVSFQ
jgi:hypothetical protein